MDQRPSDGSQVNNRCSPTTHELVEAIKSLDNEKSLTNHEVCEELTRQHATWYISAKRVKMLRSEKNRRQEQLPCVAIKIGCEISLSYDVKEGLRSLLNHLNPVTQERPHSDIEALRRMERMLPAGQPTEPLILFPRHISITSWYYQIYHTMRIDDNRPYHPVMLEIFGRKNCPRGELLIVRNGEDFNPQSAEWDVDPEELGKTLWWYMKSRIDPMKEANERRLLRYMERL
ncbi:uncharacterized protein F5891DRAFT_1201139 [Suillus fuscotomentosus]|uniref:Uncharacterized protein n=1 Tax=Suillus fuscotomentosus TaxID=1912939 RepID=A0AAD4DNH4_9AGAM|nr:uncharacterized protein F5891DRAFT_1201139 [Suillus fuscotomentosus]KAG1886357.1 hypothetical protein F5891DRAFT_1201139 [Suillus fuscotomentosus]